MWVSSENPFSYPQITLINTNVLIYKKIKISYSNEQNKQLLIIKQKKIRNPNIDTSTSSVTIRNKSEIQIKKIENKSVNCNL